MLIILTSSKTFAIAELFVLIRTFILLIMAQILYQMNVLSAMTRFSIENNYVQMVGTQTKPSSFAMNYTHANTTDSHGEHYTANTYHLQDDDHFEYIEKNDEI